MAKKSPYNILDNLGENLHTALLKRCDSKATTIAWNIIALRRMVVGTDDRNWWGDYLQHIADGLSISPSENWEGLATRVKELSFSWEFIGQPIKAALHTTFELFDEDDWMCYVSFVAEELGLVENEM